MVWWRSNQIRHQPPCHLRTDQNCTSKSSGLSVFVHKAARVDGPLLVRCLLLPRLIPRQNPEGIPHCAHGRARGHQWRPRRSSLPPPNLSPPRRPRSSAGAAPRRGPSRRAASLRPPASPCSPPPRRPRRASAPSTRCPPVPVERLYFFVWVWWWWALHFTYCRGGGGGDARCWRR